MKHLFIAVAVLIGITSPAFAKTQLHHCPKDAKIIDQSLREAFELTKLQITEVIALRAMGLAYHKDGNHGEAIKTLHAATKILGVKPYKPM